ncbi:MAG: hypothetical protein GY832_20770 [Chloroflexi bacterium]|nr:hypothetical protein [Chloroflexota bacterium]
MKRIKILKAYLWAFGILAFLWWPMGHWVYPDWYHGVLGFESYELAYVRVIGTLSVLPVMGILFTAANPLRNRDFIISLLVLSILMIGTYLLLIHTQQFPVEEYFNIILLTINTIVLSLLYPWKQKESYG